MKIRIDTNKKTIIILSPALLSELEHVKEIVRGLCLDEDEYDMWTVVSNFENI